MTVTPDSVPTISILQRLAAHVAEEVDALRAMAMQGRSRVILTAVALDLRSFEGWLRGDPDDATRRTLHDALRLIQRRLGLVRAVIAERRDSTAVSSERSFHRPS